MSEAHRGEDAYLPFGYYAVVKSRVRWVEDVLAAIDDPLRPGTLSDRLLEVASRDELLAK